MLSLTVWFEYLHCARWSDTLKMEANMHPKRNTDTETYKQEQNLSRETPPIILILISFWPLENKFYISYLLCSWRKLIRFVPLCFLRTLGNFATILHQYILYCQKNKIHLIIYGKNWLNSLWIFLTWFGILLP